MPDFDQPTKILKEMSILRWVKYTYSTSWTSRKHPESTNSINLFMKRTTHYFKKTIMSNGKESLSEETSVANFNFVLFFYKNTCDVNELREFDKFIKATRVPNACIFNIPQHNLGYLLTVHILPQYNEPVITMDIEGKCLRIILKPDFGEDF